MAGPTIKSIFTRVDTNRDQSIDKKEVERLARDVGVGDGFFGGTKVKKTVEAFMDNFDTNGDGQVRLPEMKAQGASLMPAGATGVGFRGNARQMASKVFDKMDINQNNAVSRVEMEDYIRAEMEEADVSMPATRADIAARVAMRLIDEDKSGTMSRGELTSLAEDVQRSLEPSE